MRSSLLVLFVACAPAAATVQPPMRAAEPAEAAVRAPEEAKSTEPAPVSGPAAPEPVESAPSPVPLVVRGELDGVAGDEEVRLAADGTLTAGDATIKVQLEEADPAFSDQYRLEVVALGRGRRGVLLAAPTAESEDPPNRYRVYLYDGGTLRPVFDEVIGVYGVTPLEFAGDGTASYTESGWMACSRVVGAKQVKPRRVTLALDAAGRTLQVRSRKPLARAQNCGELAACPFVYRLGDGAPELLGEILRNVRGAAAATEQSLAIGGRGEGRMAVRLAEEKPEVTFVDAVWLEVDGSRVAPRSCDDPAAPAYCAADGRHHVMREGDTLDLEFAAPPHAASRLVARGYYVPTPTASRRVGGR